MRAVFDSNVWISAFFFRGQVQQLVSKLLEEYDIYTSPFLQAEVLRVLTVKLKLPEAGLQRVHHVFETVTTLAHPTGPVPTVCRDPDDNQVLHLCQHVGAELLVTGDNDLRVLGQFGATQILSPAEVGQRWGL